MERYIYIVGAHSRARTLGVYLAKTEPDIKIKAYLYDNDEPNVDSIEGVPVIYFDENTSLETDYPVYLGTRGGVSFCPGGKAQTDGNEEDHSGHAATGYGAAQPIFNVILRGNGQKL